MVFTQVTEKKMSKKKERKIAPVLRCLRHDSGAQVIKFILFICLFIFLHIYLFIYFSQAATVKREVDYRINILKYQI